TSEKEELLKTSLPRFFCPRRKAESPCGQNGDQRIRTRKKGVGRLFVQRPLFVQEEKADGSVFKGRKKYAGKEILRKEFYGQEISDRGCCHDPRGDRSLLFWGRAQSQHGLW